MLWQPRHLPDQPDAVLVLFAETEDAARAHVDSGVADGLDRVQPVFVGSGGDDLAEDQWGQSIPPFPPPNERFWLTSG
jgi:hypothetical protein